jgi:hypothetical protein
LGRVLNLHKVPWLVELSTEIVFIPFGEIYKMIALSPKARQFTCRCPGGFAGVTGCLELANCSPFSFQDNVIGFR